MVRLRRFLVFLMLWMAAMAQPASAGPVIDAVESRVALRPCVAVAQAGDTLDTMLGQPGRFDCTTRQSALPGHEFWVDMAVPDRAGGGGDRLLGWASLWQERVTYHFIHADGHRVQRSVDAAGAARYLWPGAMFRLEVPAHPARLVRIVALVEGSANVRGVLLAPELLTPVTAQRGALGLTSLYAGFTGLCLALLGYNLMIWGVLRQGYLLAYCGMLAAGILYCLTSSGAVNFILGPIENNLRLRLNYVFLSGTAIGALMFARLFFEARVFTPALRGGFVAAVLTLVAAVAAFVLLAPWQIKTLDFLYFLSFAAALCVAAWLLYRAWHERSEYLSLYLLAWAAPLCFGAVRILHGMQLIPYDFWIDNSTLVAMSVEAVITSLIIAMRIRAMRTDRDRALNDEREARLLADTDPLTGLVNRRALVRFASGAEAAAGLYRLILVDIDRFKGINDCAGHDAGDDVLRAIADLIRERLRPGSYGARLGGEEFAILFAVSPHERRHGAGLLEAVRSAAMPRGIKVTVSIGVADGSLGSEAAWRDLYRRADAALYRAKQDGRDRLCIATHLPAVARQAA